VVTGGEETEDHAPQGGPAPPASGRILALTADPAGALRFDETRAAVLAGRVTVRLTNDSAVEHNVTIAQGSNRLGAETITESTDTLSLELAPGDYVFFCSVPGHRDSGMEGTLTVE
jgi:plastocyanin